MRLRKIPDAAERLARHPEIMVLDPASHRGAWSALFPNRSLPIRLEIGIGKGRFLIDIARKNPDFNFVGIEKFDSVILRAMEKLVKEPLANVRLVHMDAADLPLVFAPGEIDRLYLNFSDPWPKTYQAKRRLTSPLFLARYEAVMKPRASVLFKTDNFAFFRYTMTTLVDTGWAIDRISLDLHAEAQEDNVETEFESRFVQLGQPIYHIAFHYGGGFPC